MKRLICFGSTCNERDKYSKTNSLQGLAHAPTITITHNEEPPLAWPIGPQITTRNSHNDEKNCSGTFSDKWFHNMEYFSMNY